MVNYNNIGLGDCSSNTSTDANENESVVDVHNSGLGDCSSNTSNDANENESVEAHSPKRLCLVCGDIASGFHYGVASCEACKAFFKRTIQGNIEYQCPASNDCEINKRRRKACQACRFQKCLKMGMLKEGVRLDRVRGGRQKYRRTLENSSSMVQPANMLSKSRRTSLEGTSYNSNGTILSSGNSPACLLTENKILVALMSYDPDPLSLPASVTYASKSANGGNGINILSELVDKELVGTICWAKNIPGFTELILNDQMRLLQATWGEILALSLAYRSQNCSSSHQAPVPQKLVFASDFIMDESMAVQFKADEMFSLLLQLTRRLASLHMTREEYLVLKALLLTNVDILLEDAPAVHKMREQLLLCLSECSPFNPPSVHLGQILLSLPLLRQVDSSIRRFWIGVRKEGKVSMNKLFIEMLESNITIR